MYLLIVSCFTGFVFFNILFLVGKLFTKTKTSSLVKNLDNSGTIIIRIAGICTALLGIFQEVLNFKFGKSQFKYALIDKAFGNYFWIFWAVNFLLIFSTQMLWSKNLRDSKAIRVIIIILTITTFVIKEFALLNQMGSRDYLPGGWFYFSPTAVFLDFILHIGIYIAILVLVYFLTFRIREKLE